MFDYAAATSYISRFKIQDLFIVFTQCTMLGFWVKFGWLSTCLLMCLSEALVIKPCHSSNGTTVQVEENFKDLVLACEGLSLEHTTLWLYQGRFPDDLVTVIANCTGSACTHAYSPQIMASINQYNRRSHVIIPDVLRERFPDGTWMCENDGQSAQCSLDVFHKADDTQCSIEIDEEKSTVTGECQLSKMYSSHGEYSCTWFEGTDPQTEAEISPTHTQLSLLNCSEGAMYYVCGNCSFRKSLPLMNGGHSYRVVISPGNVVPSVRYVIIEPQRITDTSSTSSTSSGETTSISSTSAKTPTVDDGDVNWTNRLVWMAIGIGLSAVVVVIIIIIILICCRIQRLRRRKHCDDTSENIVMASQSAATRQGEDDDTHFRYSTTSGRPSSIRGRSDDVAENRGSALENEYSSITVPPSNGYLTPIALPREDTLENIEMASQSAATRQGEDDDTHYRYSRLSGRPSSIRGRSDDVAENRGSALENEYSSITVPPSNGCLTPIALPREDNMEDERKAVEENKGGQSQRTLPAIPGDLMDPTHDSSNKGYETPRSLTSHEPEVGGAWGGYVNKAYPEDDDDDDDDGGPCQGSSGSRLPVASKGYVRCFPQFHSHSEVTGGPTRNDSSSDSDARDPAAAEREKKREREGEGDEAGEKEKKAEAAGAGGGGGDKDRKNEGEENAKNEHAEMEKENDRFIDAAFQEKGADYIYMRNAGIPLSDPI